MNPKTIKLINIEPSFSETEKIETAQKLIAKKILEKVSKSARENEENGPIPRFLILLSISNAIFVDIELTKDVNLTDANVAH